ncbi:gamma-glutamyl-gamma-aminobutyrate hydrolase family protein [bacterium]|nr:gamma-glutamyl-gamma-aminobutyrate hydrolase family protein [bacterium]
MGRTIIGITTYGRNEQDRYSLPANYVDCIRRAGGIAVLLPPSCDRVDEWFEIVDGFVLAGGGDIAPAIYGGLDHETIYSVDPDRDGCELEIARRVVESRRPALGICRGAQVVNVALGGTLHEHVPDAYGEEVVHRHPERHPIRHRVLVHPESGLARITESLDFESASIHHQAVRDLAPALRACAHAPDGVVEAIEMPDHPWLYAVQWHPELTAFADPAQQRIFDALVAAASVARERTPSSAGRSAAAGRS